MRFGVSSRSTLRSLAGVIAIVVLMAALSNSISTRSHRDSTHRSARSMAIGAAVARSIPVRSSAWVVARGDGSVVRSSGLAGLIRLRRGVYEARFTQNVSSCVYTAVVGDPSDHLVFNPGLVFTAGGHLSGEGVYVETKTLVAGSPISRSI